MSLLPTNELVAIAWLKGITDLPTDAIGTTLPAVDSWADTGFIEVGVVGGSPDRDIPVRRPVLGIQCWAANANSGRPPWGKANQLAEIIAAACYGGVDDVVPSQRVVTMHVPGYQQARVTAAYFVTEPRRIPRADDARYAMYSGDLQMHWTAAP